MSVRGDEPDAGWAATAAAALTDACHGWQRNRRCTDRAGVRILHPHPYCLDAQYRHDLILLEHGLLHATTRE